MAISCGKSDASTRRSFNRSIVQKFNVNKLVQIVQTVQPLRSVQTVIRIERFQKFANVPIRGEIRPHHEEHEGHEDWIKIV
jgi:hypothetical protein